MTKGITTAQKALIVFFLLIIIAGGAVRLYFLSDFYNNRAKAASTLEISRRAPVQLLAVDVDGAINRPGTYEVPQGATRAEAVRLAGGLLADANTRNVNLAARAADGEKIYIPYNTQANGVETTSPIPAETPNAEPPRQLASGNAGAADKRTGETDAGAVLVYARNPASGNAAKQTSPASKNRASGKKNPRALNINTATENDLQCLPGIGPSTARKIVEMRKLRGPFTAIEQIMLVKGIGEKKFDKIRIYLRVK